MQGLDRLSSYFKDKERKRLDALSKQSRDGLPEMSADEIKLSCLENNGYETPELNDKLYLHFRGFKKIENLEPYTGCHAIWLDSNGLTQIEGLDTMTELRCLYISKNLIQSISSLDKLQQLNILDLSYNRLTHIENLSILSNLQTLNISHNQLNTPSSIAHLQECQSLSNIDITNNRLADDEDFFPILSNIPCLVALSINNNEITRHSHFRKRLINSIPKLGYLDRPIDEVERLCAIAFMSGGADAEATARATYRDLQTQKRKDEAEQFKKWQQEHRQTRINLEANKKLPRNHYVMELSAEEKAEREQAKIERLKQAAIDAAEERELLSHGVEAIAKKYWLLNDSNNNNRSVDILTEASKMVLEEKLNEKSNVDNSDKNLHNNSQFYQSNRVEELDSVDEIDTNDINFDIPIEEKNSNNFKQQMITSNGKDTSEATGSGIPSENMEKLSIQEEYIKNNSNSIEDNSSSSVAQYKENIMKETESALNSATNDILLNTTLDSLTLYDSKNNTSSKTVVNSSNNNTTTSVSMNVEKGNTSSTRNIPVDNTQLVDESMKLFKQQMLMQTNKNITNTNTPNNTKNITPTTSSNSHTIVNTNTSKSTSNIKWDDDDDNSAFSQLLHQSKVIWSESMDRNLVQCVKEHSPNYEEISKKMQIFMDNELNNGTEDDKRKLKEQKNKIILTSDACRVRWYQLDPNQWTSGNNNNNSSNNNNRFINNRVPIPPVPSFKVYATRTTSVSPAAATFEALNRRAASSVPTYLQRPVFLPSMNDDDDDDDNDETTDDENTEESKNNNNSTAGVSRSSFAHTGSRNNSQHRSVPSINSPRSESDDDSTITPRSVTSSASTCVSQISVQFEESSSLNGMDGLD